MSENNRLPVKSHNVLEVLQASPAEVLTNAGVVSFAGFSAYPIINSMPDSA